MKKRSRRGAVVVAGVVLAVGSAGARGADGVISTGATIAAGSGSPAGTVTVDSCGPLTTPPDILPFPFLNPIGSQRTSAPTFGGAGAGGAAFATSQLLTTLAAGTHEYASFTVSAGHVVRADGPLVIRATGDVLIEGTLETLSGSAAPIEIHAGGSITVRRQGTQICFVGPAGAGGGGVTLDAMGALFVGGTQPDSYRANVAYPGNAVTIVSQDTSTGITIDGALCGQLGGAVVVDAPKMSISKASLAAGNASADVRVRGGSLTITDSLVSGTSSTVEVTGALTLTRSGIEATNGDLTVRAYSGDLSVNGSTIRAIGGGAFVDVAASGSVAIEGDSDLANTSGSILFVTAHGGDVRVDALGGSTSSNVNGSGPSCSTGIVAAQDILIHADADVAGELGLSLTAQRDIIVRGDPLLRSGTHPMTIRASGVLSVGPHAAGPLPTLVFGDLYATADGTGASSVAFGFTGTTGPVTLLSRGALTVTGSLTAGGDVSIASLEGGVTAAAAAIATSDAPAGDSSDVEIASWAGCGTTIDLTDATIRSGDASGRSGDVKVVVKSDVPAPVGSLLVTRATVKDRAGPSDITFLEGVLDIGDGGEPAGNIRVRVGSYDATFAVQRSGRTLRGTSGTSSIVFTPPRTGGSRYEFKATIKADSTLLVLEDGRIDVEASRIVVAGPPVLYGGASLSVTGGKYVLGARGRFLSGSATLWVESGSVRFSDKGPDSASGTFVVPGGTLPPEPSDIHIEHGGIVIDAPATLFVVKSPGILALPKGAVAGVKSLVVNAADGTITFSATGEFDPGEGSVVVVESTLVIGGGAPLSTTVRIPRVGRRASY